VEGQSDLKDGIIVSGYDMNDTRGLGDTTVWWA
jgi:hypothetical protein